jgi:hypothetical protein
MLHDAAFREAAKARIKALRKDSQRQWGKMSVDQMLWHLNIVLENALGKYPIKPANFPVPNVLMKFLVINVPWRKGNTPTAPEFVATQTYDLEGERARLLQLIDEFAAKPVQGPWNDSPFAGPMSGRDWTRLQGKHVHYHLQQFGA